MLWLEQMFAPDSVPPFEMNDYTMAYLFSLARVSQEKTRHAEILIKEFHTKAVEYEREGTYYVEASAHFKAQRLRDLLDRIALNQTRLSQGGVSCTRALANTALTLGMANSAVTRFVVVVKLMFRLHLGVSAHVIKTTQVPASEQLHLESLASRAQQRALQLERCLKASLSHN
jgi:hypothetical protein